MLEKKSFTLMELMVVVTIAGIVAGFAIPNCAKSLDRAAAQDAVTNLKIIAAAQRAYYGLNGTYYPSVVGAVGLASINSNLHINIMTQQNIVYSCGAQLQRCTATNGTWTYTIVNDQLATCSAGPCPYTPQ